MHPHHQKQRDERSNFNQNLSDRNEDRLGRGSRDDWQDRSFAQDRSFSEDRSQGGRHDMGDTNLDRGRFQQERGNINQDRYGSQGYNSNLGHQGYGNQDRFANQGYGSQGFNQSYGHQGYGNQDRFANQGYGSQGFNQGYGNQDRFANQGYGNQDRMGSQVHGTPERSWYQGYGQERMGNQSVQDSSRSELREGRSMGGSFREQGQWNQGSESGGMNRPFLGKGPKGYIRSDERIREEICELLSEGHLDASDIDVTVHSGEVTLTGTVCDRRTKRMAEEIVEGARGVKDIQNQLKVQSSQQSAGQQQGSGLQKTGGLQKPGETHKTEGKLEGASKQEDLQKSENLPKSEIAGGQLATDRANGSSTQAGPNKRLTI